MVTKHKVAFRQLYMYLLSNYGIELDRSGSDISRLCFLSWDPYLVLKDTSSVFEVKYDDLSVPQYKKNNKEGKAVALKKLDWNHVYGMSDFPHNSENRFKLNTIYKKLLKKKVSITDTYENWVKVAPDFSVASPKISYMSNKGLICPCSSVRNKGAGGFFRGCPCTRLTKI